MMVAIKDQEKTAVWEKTCSKAHAAVGLQSPCSCRCFGSRTSMFSIHCKVLRVGRRKKEGILVQNRRERKNNRLVGWGGITAEIPTSKQSFKVQYKLRKVRGMQWPDCSTDWSCSQSTDHDRLVGAPGRECLTLQHVAAGSFFFFSKEIFKGLQYED